MAAAFLNVEVKTIISFSCGILFSMLISNALGTEARGETFNFIWKTNWQSIPSNVLNLKY